MKTIKIQQFKVRCSALGDITTEPQQKSNKAKLADNVTELHRLNELQAQAVKKDGKQYIDRAAKIELIKGEIVELEKVKHIPSYSGSLKSYCEQWLVEQITGVCKEISSKEMEKGIWCEDEAIQLAGRHFGWFMPEKNTERRCNDWLTGECDVVLPNSIEDIKCPYDVQTFPNFSREIPVKGYENQLQGYMELWDKDSAGLVYVLVETPEDIDPYGTCAQPFCGYSTWELSERIRRYQTERNKQFIALARDRVADCRVYIAKELIPELQEWKKIKIEIAS